MAAPPQNRTQGFKIYNFILIWNDSGTEGYFRSVLSKKCPVIGLRISSDHIFPKVHEPSKIFFSVTIDARA